MADITLCSGKGCPIAAECKRFDGNTPSGFRQSYFMEPPWKSGEGCEHLIPMQLTVKIYKRDAGEKEKRTR
jgi:hypothetical protein